MTETTVHPPTPTRDAPARPLPRAGLVAAVLALPAAVLAATAIARFVNGEASVDVALFDQILWRVSHGGAPTGTIIRDSLLEDHFGPGILVFAPLYWIVASPVWLFVAQAAAAWAAASSIARRLIGPLGWKGAAAVGCLLLLSPPVAWGVLFDVHPVVLAVPFVLAGVWKVEEGRPWMACWLGLVGALFRPDAAFAVLAAYLVLPGRRAGRLRPTLVLATYVMAATALELALGKDGGHWALFYSHLGSTPFDALVHPWRALSFLAQPHTAARLLPWVAVTGLLAVRNWRYALPALAVAVPSLLSSWPAADDWTSHYGFAPALLLAPAAVAPIFQRPEFARRMMIGVFGVSLAASPFLPTLVAQPETATAFDFWTPNREILCLTRGIPGDAGVATTAYLTPLFAHREHLYVWPHPFAGLDYPFPGPHGDPDRAASVDYVIRERGHGEIPPGFLDDGSTPHLERLRRSATTDRARLSCESL